MPIYEYRCDKCDHSFEELVNTTLMDIVCPNCKSPEVQRLLSVFAASAGSNSSDATVSSRPGCSSGFT